MGGVHTKEGEQGKEGFADPLFFLCNKTLILLWVTIHPAKILLSPAYPAPTYPAASDGCLVLNV